MINTHRSLHAISIICICTNADRFKSSQWYCSNPTPVFTTKRNCWFTRYFHARRTLVRGLVELSVQIKISSSMYDRVRSGNASRQLQHCDSGRWIPWSDNTSRPFYSLWLIFDASLPAIADGKNDLITSMIERLLSPVVRMLGGSNNCYYRVTDFVICTHDIIIYHSLLAVFQSSSSRRCNNTDHISYPTNARHHTNQT